VHTGLLMSRHSSSQIVARMRSSHRLQRVAGAAVALLGAVILVAWHLHWRAILQILPGLPTMKYNTAACLILYSGGIVLLTTRYARAARAPAGLVAVVALLTLIEYLTPLHFGIDELLLKDYIFDATTNPGRMSPLTASCFALFGAGLIAAAPSRHTWRLALVGVFACIVAVIALVALCGYPLGIQVASGWGSYTRMSIYTAVAFLTLSVALLRWAWGAAQRSNFGFLRWLPVSGSVTLMAMVAFVSSVSLTQLKKSLDWRTHTYEVLLATDALRTDFADTFRGARGYAMGGQAVSLEPYRSGLQKAPLQLARLRALTPDYFSLVTGGPHVDLARDQIANLPKPRTKQ
jgi:CHASE3 domain